MNGERNFGDFLTRLSGETDEAIERVTPTKKPAPPAPVERKQTRQVEPEYIEEEQQQEEQLEEQETMDEDNSIDIVEKSLDYAKSVMSVIRENFSKNDQKIILETLKNTINTYLLSESGRQPQFTSTRYAQPQQGEKQKSSMFAGQTMTEAEWNAMNNVSYDEEQPSFNKPLPQKYVTENKNRPYNKTMELNVKLGANGKPEVDLSRVSQQDIVDMQILSGIK